MKWGRDRGMGVFYLGTKRLFVVCSDELLGQSLMSPSNKQTKEELLKYTFTTTTSPPLPPRSLFLFCPKVHPTLL